MLRKIFFVNKLKNQRLSKWLWIYLLISIGLSMLTFFQRPHWREIQSLSYYAIMGIFTLLMIYVQTLITLHGHDLFGSSYFDKKKEDADFKIKQ